MPEPGKRTRSNGLRSDPHNARKHPERNKALIRKSLEEIGGFRSIGVDGENIVRAGNGVLEQAQALGLKIRVIDAKPDELIAVRRPDLKGKRAVRAALLDNRTNETSEWDTDVLAGLDGEFLDGLWEPEEFDVLLQNNGITPEELEDPEPQIDRAAELQEKWRTERGQLWLIPSKTVPGKAHRLLCGDSTKAEQVTRVMVGETADAVVSDPPYGMKWSADASRFTGGKFGDQPRGREREDVVGDDRPFDPRSLLSFPTVVLWGFNHFCDKLPPGGVFVWVKKPDDRFGSFLSDCDLAWTNKGRGIYAIRHFWGGITRESERGEFLHPTQKPAVVMAWVIEKSKAGRLIFDPYSGSGTTIVAAEQLGRLCYGIEIEPKYVAVTLERLTALGLAPEIEEKQSG